MSLTLSRNQLEALRVEDLRSIARVVGTSLSGLTRKSQIVDALVGQQQMAAPTSRQELMDVEFDLERMTVAQLRALAKERRTSLTGLTRKADIIRALRQERVQAPTVSATYLRDLVDGIMAASPDVWAEFGTRWRYLVSKVSERYDLSAAEAARVLSPYYQAEQERSRSPRRMAGARSRR